MSSILRNTCGSCRNRLGNLDMGIMPSDKVTTRQKTWPVSVGVGDGGTSSGDDSAIAGVLVDTGGLAFLDRILGAGVSDRRDRCRVSSVRFFLPEGQENHPSFFLFCAVFPRFLLGGYSSEEEEDGEKR